MKTLNISKKKEHFQLVLGFALEILSVLVYLAKRRLIMIDLKETNIMVQIKNNKKSIKIIDYGGYIHLKDENSRNTSIRVRKQFSTRTHIYQ